MDMKKLLNIVAGNVEKKQINESIEECGTMPTQMPQTPPVSMSVSMNAQGVDQIKEILNLMANAQAERMSEPSVVIGPDKMIGMEKEEFANEPGEEYRGIDASIASGDDLHKSKSMYKAAAGGDNPMAAESIRLQLDRLYQEIKEGKKTKKAKPDFLDLDDDGNRKESMKKAAKDVAEASGVRATDKKKGKVDKSERKQYFVKLEKEGKTKGMTIVADEGESEGELRDRVKRDNIGWTVAGIRVKEAE